MRRTKTNKVQGRPIVESVQAAEALLSELASQCGRATGRKRRLARFRKSMKQGLQLLFTCFLSFQPTAQPSHYRRHARLSGYLSAAIIQSCGQEPPFSRVQRDRLFIGWKFLNQFRYARNRGGQVIG
jgi:hypothetical protein